MLGCTVDTEWRLHWAAGAFAVTTSCSAWSCSEAVGQQKASTQCGHVASAVHVTLMLHGSLCCPACRLAKDPARWGVVEGDGASVFYVLLPPWCRTNKQAMQHN